MAIYHFCVKILSRSKRNTVRALAYRAGVSIADPNGIERFDYSDKDVPSVQLFLPNDAPSWIRSIQAEVSENRQSGVQRLSNLVERAERRKDAQVYRELEFALPMELSDAQNKELVGSFLGEHLCSKGISALACFHLDISKEGEPRPHVHVLLLMRELTAGGLSLTKNRDWNRKEFLEDLREQWASSANAYLEKQGSDARIDHRSYADLGIALEPQVKLGMRVQATGGRMLGATPDRIRAFDHLTARNILRLLKNPSCVFDIVTKNQATFVWGDVAAVLGRYIDDVNLYQRLDSQLRSSPHLIFLRTIQTPNGGEEAVFTTRSLQEQERTLMRHGETLSQRDLPPARAVDHEAILAEHDKALKSHGGLTQEQRSAILEMTSLKQLSCSVGYAGSGKTTCLRAVKDIWEARGYRLYGLAPTGKAAANLAEVGLNAQTIHRFLGGYDRGQNRLSPQSVLILDEAGMVDVDRFGWLLKIVHDHGLKCIVMGDGGQLQAVEAGAAFKMLTGRMNHAKLETIVRQKKDWQRAATKAFGTLMPETALQIYDAHGSLKIIAEARPALREDSDLKKDASVVEHYAIARRLSGRIALVIQEDLEKIHGFSPDLWRKYARSHQDYAVFQDWQRSKKDRARAIVAEAPRFRDGLLERRIDTKTLLAEALGIHSEEGTPKGRRLTQGEVESYRLPVISEGTAEHRCDLHKNTRRVLIQDWLSAVKKEPDKDIIMLSYTNQDVDRLNQEARQKMKELGILSSSEHIFKIRIHREDDFGRIWTEEKEKGFSVGDYIVFTRNDRSLGVQNGMRGRIVSFERQGMRVALQGQETPLYVAPSLYPYFDHGWAMTIHNSQGITVDQVFCLASFNQYRNLTYVAMTRHRDDVHVYGSDLDFWRLDILIRRLSDSHEKLSALDYIDQVKGREYLKERDSALRDALKRIGNTLFAYKYVSVRAWREITGRLVRDDLSQSSFSAYPESMRARLLEASKNGEGPALRSLMAIESQAPGALIVAPSPGPFSGKTEEINTGNKKETGSDTQPGISQISAEKSPSPPSSKKSLSPVAFQFFNREDVLHHLPQDRLETLFLAHIHKWVINDRCMKKFRGEMRFGSKGSFVVNLRTNQWYSHEQQVGGDVFRYLSRSTGISYRKAIQEVGRLVNAPLSSSASLADELTVRSRRHQEAPSVNKMVKLEKAQKLSEAVYGNSQPLYGTLASHYLRRHRGIEGRLPPDLRFSPAEKTDGKTFPALLVFARNPDGSLGNFQTLYLDPTTGKKADVSVQKRTIGSAPGHRCVCKQDPTSRLLPKALKPL